jgi:hypothetical protein
VCAIFLDRVKTKLAVEDSTIKKKETKKKKMSIEGGKEEEEGF